MKKDDNLTERYDTLIGGCLIYDRQHGGRYVGSGGHWTNDRSKARVFTASEVGAELARIGAADKDVVGGNSPSHRSTTEHVRRPQRPPVKESTEA